MDNLRKRLNSIETELGNITLEQYFIFLKYAIKTDINYNGLTKPLTEKEIKEFTMK